MIIISAISENRVIGSGAGMPWSVPEEYEQYLRFVGGETVVMGRRTYGVFGQDLPSGTTLIVVSRRDAIDDAVVAASLDEAIRLATESGKQVFIAGGGRVYEQAIPLKNPQHSDGSFADCRPPRTLAGGGGSKSLQRNPLRCYVCTCRPNFAGSSSSARWQAQRIARRRREQRSGVRWAASPLTLIV